MEEIIIEKGDYINGEKITNISFDPFIKGQINISVGVMEIDYWGNGSQKVYRIKKTEEENDQ